MVEPDSFASAWEDCYDELKRYVSYSVRDPFDAADILGDIAVKGLENWKSLRNRQRSREWLFQIARNKVRDYYRSHHHRYSRAVEQQDIELLIERYDAIPFGILALKELLSEMDDIWVAATLLHTLYGYTYTEISKLTGQSKRTLEKHLPNIRRKLESVVTEVEP